ncbi:ABC-2 type transport system permease protein [Lactobacillus colini]|uniref:ABC-2 type transport system permease protein n=1 Tax=Lactobacillus colini TaxID=1819254 RepID=A0ABS4MBP9_9LACO|nr:ABC transporter permease [Lactobacillus colini]MBP2057105.1 ABC-2 type transport system permease protein [Lactobacillus colini]
MNKTLIVAKNTYLKGVKSWSFILMIISPIAFIAVSILVGMFTASSSDEGNSVALVSTVPGISQTFKKSDVFEKYNSLTQAKKDLKNDDIDGYVVIKQSGDKLSANYYGYELDSTSKKELSNKLTLLQNSLNLARAKLSQKQILALNQKFSYNEHLKKDANSDDQDTAQTLSFFVLIFILYMLALTYTQVIATNIATEKGTKIMEVIFSSMPGEDYFTGKVIGVIGEIITQLAVYVVAFTGFYLSSPSIPGISGFVKDNKPMIDSIIANLGSWGLLFIIIALIICIIYAAFCGALVANPQDANKALQPILIVIMIGFILSMSVINNGNNLVSQVTSYIPLISSFIMPLRVINGHASNIEAMISIIISIVAAVGSFIWIRRIYPGLILQTEDQNMWKNFKRGLMR